MGKHFAHQIEDRKLSWWRRVEMIEQEAKLDGIYVIRTSETAEQLSAADTVRGYKSLAQVERAFRSLKGLDLLIRPIRHRTEERVPAHIFLCMLAYYVEWHLRRVWAPLLFEDEELPQAAATTRSGSARQQLGISTSQKAHAPDSRRITGTELHHSALELSQPRTCDLQLENGSVRSHVSADAAADTTAGEGI